MGRACTAFPYAAICLRKIKKSNNQGCYQSNQKSNGELNAKRTNRTKLPELLLFSTDFRACKSKDWVLSGESAAIPRRNGSGNRDTHTENWTLSGCTQQHVVWNVGFPRMSTRNQIRHKNLIFSTIWVICCAAMMLWLLLEIL